MARSLSERVTNGKVPLRKSHQWQGSSHKESHQWQGSSHKESHQWQGSSHKENQPKNFHPELIIGALFKVPCPRSVKVLTILSRYCPIPGSRIRCNV